MHIEANRQDMQRIISRYAGIIARTANPREYFTYASGVLSDSTAQTFTAQGRPTQWPRRVSDAHGRFKGPDSATHPVLRKTGRMASAAISQTDGGDSINRVTLNAAGSSFDFGLSVPYGKYHQSDRGPRRKLARRMFLLFQVEDRSLLVARGRVFFWWGQ